MSASLVGSEMCIRDSRKAAARPTRNPPRSHHGGCVASFAFLGTNRSVGDKPPHTRPSEG
eukprot:5946160-Alexandrium_andersonii.AAC.1